jgi:hypothetical protein
MLEQIPFTVFMKWALFAVTLLVVAIVLGIARNSPSGLWLAVPVFAHLWLFRPPPEVHVSDAELYEWLNRG